MNVSRKRNAYIQQMVLLHLLADITQLELSYHKQNRIQTEYVTRLRLVTYFLPPALERIKNTYCMGQRPFLYFYTFSHSPSFLQILAILVSASIQTDHLVKADRVEWSGVTRLGVFRSSK